MTNTFCEYQFEVADSVDAASGLRVRRLSDGGINMSPYFNSPAWSVDGKWVFFLRVEGGEVFVAACEVETGRWRKLAGPFRAPNSLFEEDDLHWGTLKAIPGTMGVSFVADNAVWRADIDGGEGQRVAELSHRRVLYCDTDISNDGTWHVLAAVTFSEDGWERRGEMTWPPDDFYEKYLIESKVFRVALDGSGRVEALFDVPKACVSHLSLNPVDPELLMYCHDSNYAYRWGRMFLTRIGETAVRPLRDQRTGKVYATHERWFEDGKRVMYHGFYQRHEDEWPPMGSYVGYIDTERDLPFEFLIDGPRYAFSHTVPSPDGTRFLMDMLPCEKEAAQCLYEVILDREKGTCRYEVICSVTSDLEPLPIDQWRTIDPIFSPDGKRVLFRAADKGELHIYVLYLES